MLSFEFRLLAKLGRMLSEAASCLVNSCHYSTNGAAHMEIALFVDDLLPGEAAGRCVNC
jgi:hypothetical protein